MKREQAVEFTSAMLSNLVSDCGEWPLRVVRSITVFGSFARGALEPRDVDVLVEIDRSDRDWQDHEFNLRYAG
jgi:predicted nucleotidyltransferase